MKRVGAVRGKVLADFQSPSEPRQFLDNVSVGESHDSTSSSQYEFAKATRRKNRIIMETVKVSGAIADAREVGPASNSEIMMEDLVKIPGISHLKMPTIDEETLRFDSDTIETEYKEELAIKSRNALKWSILSVSFSSLTYVLYSDAPSHRLFFLAGSIIHISLVIKHLWMKYNYRSYLNTLSFFYSVMILECLFGHFSDDKYAVAPVLLIPIPLIAIMIRANEKFFKLITRVYISTLSVIIVRQQHNIAFWRQIPILVLYGYIAEHLFYSTEKSNRIRFLNQKKIEILDCNIEAEKKKLQRMIEKLYPRKIANDLQSETVQSLKNYRSKKVFVIAIGMGWMTPEVEPSIADVENAQRHINSIFEKFRVDLVKMRGDMVLGCKGMFDDIEGYELVNVISAARSIIMDSGLLDKSLKHQFSIGLSFGEAFCISIHCKKSAVDIFGSCVEEAMRLACLDSQFENKIYASRKVIDISSIETRRLFKLVNELKDSYQYRMKTNTIEEELSLLYESESDRQITEREVSPTRQKFTIDTKDSMWVISQRTEEKTIVIGDNLNTLHGPNTGMQLFSANTDLHDQQPPHIDAKSRNQTSLKQIKSTLLIFFLYGLSDLIIYHDEEYDSWEKGGPVIFYRLGVIFPCILSLSIWLTLTLDEGHDEYQQNLRQWITISIYGICLFYTSFSRSIMVTGYLCMPSSPIMTFSQWTEAYFYVEGGLSNVLSNQWGFNLLNILEIVTNMTYFSINSSNFQQISTISAYLSIMTTQSFVLWKMTQIKRMNAEQEAESHVLQIQRIKQTLEQTEHAESCLHSILPASFIEAARNGDVSSENKYSNVCIVIVGIDKIGALVHSLTVDEFKLLLTEVFTEIESLAHAHQGELIKTLGPTYTIAFGLDNSSKRSFLSIIEEALIFATNIVHHFGLFACKENGRKIYTCVGASCGSCLGGVADSGRISFDIWGNPVSEARQALAICQPYEIVIHEKMADLIGFETTKREEEKGTVIRPYLKYRHVFDVWSQFIKNVDWDIDNDLLSKYDTVR